MERKVSFGVSIAKRSTSAPSPQAGAPTSPDPTLMLFLSSEPTFLEFREMSESVINHDKVPLHLALVHPDLLLAFL